VKSQASSVGAALSQASGPSPAGRSRTVVTSRSVLLGVTLAGMCIAGSTPREVPRRLSARLRLDWLGPTGGAAG
jgi:hypothetical protein